jgi:hypothetical protein
MEEHKSTAGQGLGIAGLIMGIMAIPMGLIPCTFYIGIIFGIIGIVLSLVALSQANRGFGPKNLIIAALVCSIVGLTFATVWGFTLSRDGARLVREIIHNNTERERPFDEFRRDARDILDDLESDTATLEHKSSDELKHMTDTLKELEGESEAQPK